MARMDTDKAKSKVFDFHLCESVFICG